MAIRNGADVDSRDWFGWTALHWAVSGGHMSTASNLLHNRADPNAADQTGETALHWAAANDNVSMVELLINNRASPDLNNKNGKLPADLTMTPAIRELCRPAAPMPGPRPAGPGPHDIKYATMEGTTVNGLLACIASEQKARAHIQRKLMTMSELQRTLEDYKVQFARATTERKEADLRLQAIRPQLERERRGREESEKALRDKRHQIEDLRKRLDDANEKIVVARRFATEIEELQKDTASFRDKRELKREELRSKQKSVDTKKLELNQLDDELKNEQNLVAQKEAEFQSMRAEEDDLTDQIKQFRDDIASSELDIASENFMSILDVPDPIDRCVCCVFQAAKSDLARLKDQQNSLDKDMAKAKTEHEKEESEMKKTRDSILDTQDKIRAKEMEYEKIKEDIKELEREIEKLKIEIHS